MSLLATAILVLFLARRLLSTTTAGLATRYQQLLVLLERLVQRRLGRLGRCLLRHLLGDKIDLLRLRLVRAVVRRPTTTFACRVSSLGTGSALRSCSSVPARLPACQSESGRRTAASKSCPSCRSRGWALQRLSPWRARAFFFTLGCRLRLESGWLVLSGLVGVFLSGLAALRLLLGRVGALSPSAFSKDRRIRKLKLMRKGKVAHDRSGTCQLLDRPQRTVRHARDDVSAVLFACSAAWTPVSKPLSKLAGIRGCTLWR